MNYDFEKRKKAFVIIANKLYEGDTHFECMWKALDSVIDEEELDYNFDKYWNMEDCEIKKLFGDDEIAKGEIMEEKEEKFLILYDKCDINKSKKYYNHKICLYDNMTKH